MIFFAGERTETVAFVLSILVKISWEIYLSLAMSLDRTDGACHRAEA